MDIESLSSLFFQPSSGLETSGLQTFILNNDETAVPNTFFEELAKQMNELANPEQLQIFADGLNPEPVSKNIDLSGGNVLPQTIAAMPESDLPADEWELEELNTPNVVIAQPVKAIEVLPAKSDTPGKPAPVLTGHEKSNVTDNLLATADIPELEHPELPAKEVPKSDFAVLEKQSTESSVVPKGEVINPQTSIRSQALPEKTPVLSMDRPVSHPEWKQDLGDRIVWMTRNTMSTAELKVNPPQMGPVEVRINLNQDQTNIVFASQNAAVREAIEVAVPRLKEMLGTQQLNLTNVDVSHSFNEHRQQQTNGEGSGQSYRGSFSDPILLLEESLAESVESDAMTKNQGLLNYYV